MRNLAMDLYLEQLRLKAEKEVLSLISKNNDDVSIRAAENIRRNINYLENRVISIYAEIVRTGVSTELDEHQILQCRYLLWLETKMNKLYSKMIGYIEDEITADEYIEWVDKICADTFIPDSTAYIKEIEKEKEIDRVVF